MKKQRPVNLNLNTIKFPPSAISSILHRVTGVAMFFALVFVMWAWAVSLSSATGFEQVVEVMSGVIGRIIAIGTLSVLSYHLLAGLRHFVMDLGYWEELDSGNNSANAVIVLWVIISILEAVALW